ncbi:ribosomal protein, L4/L1 family protein [Vibrio cholerae]|nr:ribosomal protein, L4/L1 family protein [Vibrio cholerae]KKP20411.1 ribosomal protein, L4/L1 family protein [Vibrio cholerae]
MLKRHVQKFLAVALSHGVKKVLAVHVLVQSVAQSGVQVVLLLLRNHKITAKK